MTINRRYKMVREVCLALEFIHKNGMVHLDIKPENIFVSLLLNIYCITTEVARSIQSHFILSLFVAPQIKNDQFKLGDFGLVSKISSHQDVEEGDSRYMSMELLSGDHADLTKSDIFSLGITLYETCLEGKQLPPNGPSWQALRAAELPPLRGAPDEMCRIIKLMLNPMYRARPSAADLLKRPQLLSDEQKELLAEKNKVVQANLALLSQQNHLRMFAPKIPKRTTLVRRSTWNGH